MQTINNNDKVSKALLSINSKAGFVPNIYTTISHSTPALLAFVSLGDQFSLSSFNSTEQEVIQLSTSVKNHCNYCVAGHTAFAYKKKIAKDIIESLRNNEEISDSKLQALSQFTKSIIHYKGMVPSNDYEAFIDAGYTENQALEVILGICLKTFSNYTNNLIGIPLDEPFLDHKWEPEFANSSHFQAQEPLLFGETHEC